MQKNSIFTFIQFGFKEEVSCTEVSFTIADTSARSEFFGGGWQAVSLGGGMTVMEKREILAGWVTKVCLKCTKKAGVGREGHI